MKKIYLIFTLTFLPLFLAAKDVVIYVPKKLKIETQIYSEPIFLDADGYSLNGNKKPSWIDFLKTTFSIGGITFEGWKERYSDRAKNEMKLTKERFARVKEHYKTYNRAETYLYSFEIQFGDERYVYIGKINGKYSGVFDEDFSERHTVKVLVYDESKSSWLLDSPAPNSVVDSLPKFNIFAMNKIVERGVALKDESNWMYLLRDSSISQFTFEDEYLELTLKNRPN